MFDQGNQFRDQVFSKNSQNDPFREENFLYKNSEEPVEEESGHIFKLNVNAKKEKSTSSESAAQKHEIKQKDDPKKHEPQTDPPKRSIKEIFRDASRQIIASAVILVIGFLALNWEAYYQNAKYQWDKLMGNENNSPLHELVEENPQTPEEVTLETSKNQELQKKQIPDLNLEIAPIDNRLIIPRIDKNIPVVNVSSENLIKRDWAALEGDMQDALQYGVVHYPGTSIPGENGNVVITGHSSYFPWDPGRFKDVFALLHEVVEGDKIVVYYDQEKYLYEVEEIEVVLPENIDVLKQTPADKLTLITCTPVGTNLKRLVVTASPVIENEKVVR